MTISQLAPPSISSSIDTNRIFVIIPALDEETTVGSVVTRLREIGLNRIRVVDNGSADRTANRAKAAGADVLVEPQRGYGQACWRGIQDLPSEVEWILFCDADGSDDLDDLPRLLKATSGTDLVLGNRRAIHRRRSSLTPLQNLGNALATFLIRLGWGYRYHDLGPLRLIRRRALERMELTDRGFGWTIEMQLCAIEMGLKIREVPVAYHPRQAGKSKISGTFTGCLKAGVAILTTLVKFYFRPKCSLKVWNSFVKWLAGVLILGGVLWSLSYGNFNHFGNVPKFLGGMVLIGVGFLLSLLLKEISGSWLWIVAILARLLFLPMEPGGDIYRYIWEGHIQNHNFSPYQFEPNAPELEFLRNDIWQDVEHKGISAIYPPLAEFAFRMMTAVSLSPLWFKIGFVFADLLMIWLLQRRFGNVNALVYAWNPLIIYSFAGGGHYDSWFILCLVAGWLLLEQDRKLSYHGGGLLCLGAAVALKWMALPILGWVLWRLLRQEGWKSAAKAGIWSVLPFALSWWFIPGPAHRLIPTNFTLYARSAEFLPALVGWIWPASLQINRIYLVLLGVVCLAFMKLKHDLIKFSEIYFFVLYLLSPVIHAWYFTWMIPFAVASRNAGTLAVSLSSFVYFWIHHTSEKTGGSWKQSIPEKCLMWLPFILGFCWWQYQSWRQNQPSA